MQKILAINFLLPSDLNSGGRIYSYYLFQALSKHALVTAIGLDCGGKAHLNDWVQKVVTIPRRPRRQFLSALSKYPNVVFQCRTASFKKVLRELVQNESYDIVICMHFATFWAAEFVNKERQRLGKARIPTVLITQNHEALARVELERYENNPLKSLVYYVDREKTKWHENMSFLTFDKITAITSDDARSINAVSGKKIDVLTPGYSGQVNGEHRITQETNRQVVILGSYHWIVKQLNLKQLIKASASLFLNAKIKMLIIGDGPASLFTELSQYPFLKIIGRVESFERYLEESRIAIISETSGGGFRLKSLDYVYRKVPMAVIKGTMSGLPLQPNIDYLEYPSLKELVEGVVREIDNVDKLNMLASNAFVACQDKFKWEDRGRSLNKIASGLTGK